MFSYEKIIKFLSFPPPVLFCLTWGLLSCIFMADRFITIRFNLFPFYLVPIFIVTLNEGIRRGLLISLFSAIFWLVAELMAGHVYSFTIIPYWNALMRLSLFVGGALLVHYWSETNLLASTDVMTGLKNRRSYLEAVEVEIQRCGRFGHPISLAFIDLDDLKSANDVLGHKAGDQMIRDLAKVIRGSIRAIDVAARMGGDEFSVLMPETDAKGGQIALERIVNRLKGSRHPNSGTPLTISAGLATSLNVAMSPDAFIQKADRLMYEAKRAGKNCMRTAVFTSERKTVS